MNDLILTSNQLTMSSKDISILLGTRHDSVKRTIDRLVDNHVISRPPMVDGEKAANGVFESVYKINKRSSYIIVAQLSPEFTADLVDRWQELEAKEKPALPDFTNPVIAAREWANAKEAEMLALSKLEEAKPAIQFVERYVESEQLKGFREVAKLLKIKEPELRAFLVQEKIMYKLGGIWTAYQNHIDAGRFKVVAVLSSAGFSANETKFTTKGVEWLYRMMDKS
jgi:phage antirepressor YoqD-like protein